MTDAEIHDLVSRLSEEQMRAILAAQLAAATEAAAPTDGSEIDALKAAGDRARDRLRVVLAARARLGEGLSSAWSALSAEGRTSGLWLLACLAIGFAVALATERVLVRMTGTLGRREPTDARSGTLGRWGLALVRAAVEVVALLIGVVAAALTLFVLLLGNEAAPLTLIHIVAAVAVIRAARSASDAALAPSRGWQRPVPVGDEAARAIHARLVAFVAIWVLLSLPGDLARSLVPDAEIAGFVRLTFSALLLLAVIALVVEGRQPIADYISGQSREPRNQTLASRWHVFACVYLVALWLLAVAVSLSTGRDVSGASVASLLLLIAIPVVDSMLRSICDRISTQRTSEHDEAQEAVSDTQVTAEAPEDGPTDATTAAVKPSETEALRETSESKLPGDARGPGSRNPYRASMLRNARIVAALVWIVLFARLWDLDLRVLAGSVVGNRIAGSLFEIVGILVLAYALWSFVEAAVARAASGGQNGADADDGDEDEPQIGGVGLSRVATLLPLLRKIVAVTLTVFVALTILSALGVSIGPLIAGAGVVGIAIGFGAQTLVRDVISGFFFLLDDAFRMGEYVEIDDIRGSVERISVRSLQLRHHNGPVHTLPFGDIRHVTNYSRDWAIMKFEIRLPFETDIDKVRKIIKGVGKEMSEDQDLAENLLEPLKSQGVNRMDDSALIVRCKFKAKPGQQFVLRREAYTRIQTALAEEGITFAPRRVIVETSSGRAPTPAEMQAAAGQDDSARPA